MRISIFRQPVHDSFGKTRDRLESCWRRIREMRGFDINQAEFAREIGVSQGQLSRYEQGSSEIGAAVLLRLARKAGKTIEWLLTGKENAAKISSVTAVGLRCPRANRQSGLWRSLSWNCPSAPRASARVRVTVRMWSLRHDRFHSRITPELIHNLGLLPFPGRCLGLRPDRNATKVTTAIASTTNTIYLAVVARHFGSKNGAPQDWPSPHRSRVRGRASVARNHVAFGGTFG